MSLIRPIWKYLDSEPGPVLSLAVLLLAAWAISWLLYNWTAPLPVP